MSTILDKLQGEDKGASWYLRLQDKSVYGPVPVDNLRGWAEECRIAPGNEVSMDKIKWIPAESLPELEMNWLVQLANGTNLGPINIRAVVELVKQSQVLPGTMLIHKTTGESIKVGPGDVLEKIAASGIPKLAEARAAAQPAAASAATQPSATPKPAPAPADSQPGAATKTAAAPADSQPGAATKSGAAPAVKAEGGAGAAQALAEKQKTSMAQDEKLRQESVERTKEIERQKELVRKMQDEAARKEQELSLRLEALKAQEQKNAAAAAKEQQAEQQIKALNAQLETTRKAAEDSARELIQQQSNAFKKAQEESRRREQDLVAQVQASTAQMTALRQEQAAYAKQSEEQQALQLKRQEEAAVREQELLKKIEDLKREQDLTELGRRYRELAQQLEDAKGQVQVANGALTEKEQQAQEAREKVKELQAGSRQREQELLKEVAALTAQLEQARVAAHQEEIARQKKVIKQLQTEKDAREKELLAQIDQGKMQAEEQNRRQDSLEKQIAELTVKLQAADKAIAEKVQGSEQQTSRLQVLRERLKEVEQTLSQRAESAEAEAQRLAEAQLHLEVRAKIEKDLRDELSARENELNRLRTEFESARAAMATREETLGQSVRALQAESRQAAEKAEQLEWELKQKETQWLRIQGEEALVKTDLNRQIEEINARLGEATQRADGLRLDLGARNQELELQKKAQSLLEQKLQQFAGDQAQYKKLLEEEWARAQRRDGDLVATRQAYGEELARRQHLEAKTVDLDGQIRDLRENEKLLREALEEAQAANQRLGDQARAELATLTDQMANLGGENHQIKDRLSETLAELERQRNQADEAERQAASREGELSQLLEESKQAVATLTRKLEEVTGVLDQVRQQAQDECENLAMKANDLESREIQLKHEVEGLQLRLDQQKKFCEAEREQRRQREQDLQQLRQTYQEALDAQRAKEREFQQQHQLDEENAVRLQQREERLAARLEQLQASYASLVAGLGKGEK